MLQIGITGGIGSGKTTICKIFEVLDIPVYYADSRAKWLMVNDQQLVKDIKETFGEESYHPDQSLNRVYLADLVFNDQEALDRLNALVHPAVAADTKKWQQAQTGVPYTLKEAALLIEAGQHKTLDKLIVVTAPKEWRIQKIMQRDQIDRHQVAARMNKQLGEEEKVKYADFIIQNGQGQSLIRQVLNIHKELIKME